MTVGEQFQTARAARGLSVSDVSLQTKIQPWVLEAIESNRLLDLMSPIYVKGFLVTYAKFLRLDHEAIVTQVAWPAPEPEEEEPVKFTPVSRPRIDLSAFWRTLRPALPAAAWVGAIAALVVINPLRWMPKLTVSEPSRPKLASVSPVRETPAAPRPESLDVVLRSSQPLELTVTANRSTWVRVRADGKLVSQQWLRRGANEIWTASQQFELVVAHPSQVELMLNGQAISPLAIAHHGRLAITRQGVGPLADDQF